MRHCLCGLLDRQLTLNVEKQREVRRLVDLLDRDMSEKKLTAAGKLRKSYELGGFCQWLTSVIIEKINMILTLRQHGTNPDNADAIYCKNVPLPSLVEFSDPSDVSRE